MIGYSQLAASTPSSLLPNTSYFFFTCILHHARSLTWVHCDRGATQNTNKKKKQINNIFLEITHHAHHIIGMADPCKPFFHEAPLLLISTHLVPVTITDCYWLATMPMAPAAWVILAVGVLGGAKSKITPFVESLPKPIRMVLRTTTTASFPWLWGTYCGFIICCSDTVTAGQLDLLILL